MAPRLDTPTSWQDSVRHDMAGDQPRNGRPHSSGCGSSKVQRQPLVPLVPLAGACWALDPGPGAVAASCWCGEPTPYL